MLVVSHDDDSHLAQKVHTVTKRFALPSGSHFAMAREGEYARQGHYGEIQHSVPRCESGAASYHLTYPTCHGV
eukprot:2246056-Pleurochrysis_carterae.AAC.1